MCSGSWSPCVPRWRLSRHLRVFSSCVHDVTKDIALAQLLRYNEARRGWYVPEHARWARVSWAPGLAHVQQEKGVWPDHLFWSWRAAKVFDERLAVPRLSWLVATCFSRVQDHEWLIYWLATGLLFVWYSRGEGIPGPATCCRLAGHHHQDTNKYPKSFMLENGVTLLARCR